MQKFNGLKTRAPHFKYHHEVLFCFECSLQRFNDVVSNKSTVLKPFIWFMVVDMMKGRQQLWSNE